MIFHSYVCLPEGSWAITVAIQQFPYDEHLWIPRPYPKRQKTDWWFQKSHWTNIWLVVKTHLEK